MYSSPSAEAQIAERDAQIAEREAQIAERDAQIAEREAQIAERDVHIAAIMNSTSWKATKPIRFAVRNICKLVTLLYKGFQMQKLRQIEQASYERTGHYRWKRVLRSITLPLTEQQREHKTSVAVAYIARGADSDCWSLFERFIESYKRYTAGYGTHLVRSIQRFRE